MDWNDLRVFLIAVRAGSYSAAARRLGMDRTTVGRRIAALEAALNVTLFRDTPSGPEPTWEGRQALAAAECAEAAVEDLSETLRRGPPEPVRIRIASTAGLAIEFLDLFAAYRRDRPQLGLELLGALDPVEAVLQRRADLAIAATRIRPTRLAGVRVGALSQALYARRDAPDAPRLSWGHEMELALPGQGTAANALDQGRGDGFNNWPQLKQAVLVGLGAAYLWCFVADREPDLVRLAPPEPRWESGLWLLYRPAAPLDRETSALVEFLATALGERLSLP